MLYRILEWAPVYRLIRWLFDADRKRPILISGLEYRPGVKILDIGCGTGELSECFSPEDYVGVDISESYIQAARRQYGGTFHAMNAENINQLGDRFDRAFVNGLFHHLSDEQVSAVLTALTYVLKPDGYLFIMEDVWPSNRWNVAGRFIRWLDRGKHVRTEVQWRDLLSTSWRLEKAWLISWRMDKPWRIPSNLMEDFICVLRPPLHNLSAGMKRQ